MNSKKSKVLRVFLENRYTELAKVDPSRFSSIYRKLKGIYEGLDHKDKGRLAKSLANYRVPTDLLQLGVVPNVRSTNPVKQCGSKIVMTAKFKEFLETKRKAKIKAAAVQVSD